MTQLQLGRGLNLPLEVVSARTSILGQPGTGKTSTAVVLVEEAAAQHARFVVIDPTGAWYGLASSESGKGAGIDCVVMGGKHGDVPLEEAAGRVCAELVADQAYNLVLDLDNLGSWSARQRFVADFASELYERAHSQVLVVIDEAHRFAPQGGMGDHVARCLGAVSDLVLLGRRRGIGSVTITQRPARLHKDVLEAAEVLISHRVRGNNDRKALGGWIEEHGEDLKAMLAEIAELAKGRARVSAPTFEIDGVFAIRKKRTFDSSLSPGIGEVAIAPTARAEVDMDALRDRMAETIEKAKADDPVELRKKITKLEKTIKAEYDRGYQEGYANASAEVAEIETKIEQMEVPVFDEAELERLEKALEELHQASTEIAGTEAELANALDMAKEMRGEVLERMETSGVRVTREQLGRNAPAKVIGQERGAGAIRTSARSAPAPSSNGSGDFQDVESGAMKLVEVLVRRFPMRMTKAQLATMAGRSRKSSSFGPHVRQIEYAGLARSENGLLQATELALNTFPNAVLMSADDVIEMWVSSLSAGPARMLQGLLREGSVDGREELAIAADMSPTSSGVGTALKVLKDNGLVDVDGTTIKPAEFLVS